MKARTRDELEIQPHFRQHNPTTGHEVSAYGAWAGPGYELVQRGYRIFDVRLGMYYPNGRPPFKTEEEAEEWIKTFLKRMNGEEESGG